MKSALIVGVAIALAASSGATAASLITGSQVKDGTLTGRDIRNRSIKRADLAASARAPRGARGQAGSTGATGATGPQGAAAPPLHPVDATDASVIPAGRTFAAEPRCPGSSPYALSGAFRFTDVSGATSDATAPVVLRSEPTDGRGGWRVVARNDGPTSVVLTVTATCGTAG